MNAWKGSIDSNWTCGWGFDSHLQRCICVEKVAGAENSSSDTQSCTFGVLVPFIGFVNIKQIQSSNPSSGGNPHSNFSCRTISLRSSPE